jgi:hypothetical protein
MAVSNAEIVSTLVSAKEVLENKGWTKGRFNVKNQRFCAIGSVYQALGSGWDLYDSHTREYDPTLDKSVNTHTRDVFLATQKVLDSTVRATGRGYSVVEFNDKKAKTKNEVIELFRDAIKSLI